MPFSAQNTTKQRVTRPQNSHQIRVNFEENFNENFGQIGADFEPNSANFSAPIRSVSQNKTEKKWTKSARLQTVFVSFFENFSHIFRTKTGHKRGFSLQKILNCAQVIIYLQIEYLYNI